ncbi:hypothetical protein BDB00DRAFT_793806 [Zychaea mexicana]|uniref:uncharacterized protein n=1 Tax=Zychaea mexicana TaxID=64656 RepID=UPI0022FEAC26|nr:uncharacterized protein BDB00DRAFT_793806 [Zychaea mexicana]KAI9467720.1 hypothetical protein BDB00DRAFT_793806 [Zychaea mexicana]
MAYTYLCSIISQYPGSHNYNHLYGYGQLPHNQQQSPPTYHSNQPHYPSSSPQLAYQQQQHQQQHQQQQEAGAQPPPPPPPSQHHHHQPPPHPHAHSQQQHHHPHQTHPAYHRSASDHNDRHYVPFSPVHHHQPPPTASGPIPISAYGYVQQQSAVQQVPLSVKGGHGQKQSLERSNNNRISEEEDKQARIMSTLSREPYSNDGFNSSCYFSTGPTNNFAAIEPSYDEQQV